MKYSLFVVLVLSLVSCASADKARKNDFETLSKYGNWALESFSVNGEENYLNRFDQKLEGGEFTFSVRRTENAKEPEYLVAGKGAPNTYRTTVTVGGGGSFKLTPLASTLMMPIFEPDILKEHQYFMYIENMKTAEIVSGKLVLTSVWEGQEIVMRFIPSNPPQ